MQNQRVSAGQFTGRHMIAVMVGAFSIIIAVNLVMATMASQSWTGLIVKNSYVAGQEFTKKTQEARAQDALGWNPSLTIKDRVLTYALTDKEGRAVTLRGGTATFWRPTSDREDVTVELKLDGTGVSAPLDVHDGVWIISLVIDADLDHAYRDTRRVQIYGGTLR